MASNFIGITRGGNLQSVVVNTVTNGSDIELRYDTGKGSTKEDIVLALKNLTSYILSNGLPLGQTGVDMPKL